ncbi:MAG: DNA polymerase III subunit chi [Caulobacterales bacterium]|nr:DNA polymerase III subunit chi [Caulobacterales bacterium]
MSAAAPECWFYTLERRGVAHALAALLEKSRARGWRALVRAASPARLDEIDDILWTYRDASFLPHGRADAGMAERQPVLLTGADDNANGAEIVFVVDDAEPLSDLSGVQRCVFVFDAADETAVAVARRRWTAYKKDGRDIAAWREAENGRWAKQA